MISVLLALALAVQQQPPPTTTKPPATPAPVRRAAPAATGSIEVRITDRSGSPAADVRVTIEGPVQRSGTTGSDGVLNFRSMNAGTYRVRADGEGFISFEKEVVVRGTAPVAVELALSAAPPPPEPPPPPPPPPPAPVVAAGEPGEPRALSIPDMAERSLSGRDPVRAFPIGCSGVSRTQLLVLRESSTTTAPADGDETLYLVAGEATLKMGQKEIAMSPGWLAIVPRNVAHTVTRRGRNPAILLSTITGPPCGQSATADQP
jgi:mannose-6-phosphate isomerase-like protein (cupin superfamily)